MTNNVKIFLLVTGILILGVVATAILREGNREIKAKSGELDQFAQCLGEKGAKFYGAYWCPHCNTQKKMFGSSDKFLPYVECSTLDGRGQTLECKEKGITSYPTWEFSDGSRLSGEISLTTLATKTSCILPVDVSFPSPTLGGTSDISSEISQ